VALRHAEQLPCSLEQAARSFDAAGVAVHSLLLMGLLRVDLSKPLTADTFIDLAKDTDDDWLRLSQERVL
jgi:hypothetical protein